MKNTFEDFCRYQHDIECNQKYNGTLPYSFHLDLVAKQTEKWNYLLKNHYECVLTFYGAWGHDLIEDARITYNDIRNLTLYLPPTVNNKREELLNEVAEIIYSCTELRGRDRTSRHGDLYIQGLRNNRLGLFVKLCDIAANVGFGLLTNSSMLKKYRKEFPKFKEQLYRNEFDDLFVYIEKLLTL